MKVGLKLSRETTGTNRRQEDEEERAEGVDVRSVYNTCLYENAFK